MSRQEWLSKPIWSTAIVATLLLGAISTAVSMTIYLSNRFTAVEVRLTAIETKIETQEKLAEIKKQVFANERP